MGVAGHVGEPFRRHYLDRMFCFLSVCGVNLIEAFYAAMLYLS